MISTGDMLTRLKEYDGKPIRIMEVCGTHTAAIAKSGIRSVISNRISLLSGPGCPVCVTPPGYIDELCDMAVNQNCVILSFGDMLRVPGLYGSLNDARARGGDIRMVYSPFDGLSAAQNEPDRQFVFAAVGFETIAPVYSLLIEKITALRLKNFRIAPALKTMPVVLDLMCREDIDGFIAPGHVAAVTGSDYFIPLSQKYNKPFCISGFSAEDVIRGIYTLVCRISKNTATVDNLYSSVVTSQGNTSALSAIHRVFTPCDATWRGMGNVPNSGLCLKEEFSSLGAGSGIFEDVPMQGCRCGDVICGRITPEDCPMFGKVCTPQSPKGPCMVSHEGACGVWYENNI